MIEQATMFDLPPAPPKPPVIQAAPLGPCVKCGKDAELKSPGGNVYCQRHGYCGGKTVKETALGISVEICGKSVEKFVKHPRLGIWVCACMGVEEVR